MRKIIVAMVVLTAGAALAANVGSDNAANYGGAGEPGWTNNANAGTGFQAWNLYTSGSAGFFLGSSAGQGFGNIDTAGQAFGMWGNPAGDNYAHAARLFDGGALTVGQRFDVDLAIAWRNGNKGISLFDSGTNQLWYFNVGGDIYDAGGINLGWAYSQTSIFHVRANQTAATNLAITLTRGTDTFVTNVTGNALAGFRAYVGSTDPGNDLNNLFMNNMSVIPEPGTLALLGMAISGMVVYLRRRR